VSVGAVLMKLFYQAVQV